MTRSTEEVRPRRRSRWMRLVALALAATLAPVLAGCSLGGSDPGPTVQPPGAPVIEQVATQAVTTWLAAIEDLDIPPAPATRTPSRSWSPSWRPGWASTRGGS